MSFRIDDDTYHQLALLQTPNIGHANAKFILSHFPSVKDAFSASKAKLSKVPGIGEKAIQALQSKEGFTQADEIIKACEKKEIQLISYTSKSYPFKLKQVLDAPFLFYYLGEGLDYSRSVAIVGTREASEYGKSTTIKIVEELSSYHTTIISGLAYGIDIEAHRASLKIMLPTIGVLAGGLDRIYPSTHSKTVDKMIAQGGGILSEQPPGTKPDAHLFPARNRIIAALSDATIVVEAKVKGGALITAAVADSYDRPVFAIPGNLGNANSEGCNLLIRNQKALIYTHAKDLAYYLNWSEKGDQAQPRKAELPELTDDESLVYKLLIENPTGIAIDDLAWKSNIQINQLASVLLTLEFKGLVKALPGKRFKGVN